MHVTSTRTSTPYKTQNTPIERHFETVLGGKGWNGFIAMIGCRLSISGFLSGVMHSHPPLGFF